MLVNDTGCSSASNSLQCLRDLPFATLKAGVDKSPDFLAYDVGCPKCDGTSTYTHVSIFERVFHRFGLPGSTEFFFKTTLGSLSRQERLLTFHSWLVCISFPYHRTFGNGFSLIPPQEIWTMRELCSQWPNTTWRRAMSQICVNLPFWLLPFLQHRGWLPHLHWAVLFPRRIERGIGRNLDKLYIDPIGRVSLRYWKSQSAISSV